MTSNVSRDADVAKNFYSESFFIFIFETLSRQCESMIEYDISYGDSDF